jgi:type II secretory pathway predicted ATPase ExeA
MTFKSSPQVTHHLPQRLQLSVLMQAKGLSYSVLANLARVPRSSLYALASKGVWPSRSDPAVLADTLRQALQTQGATPDELADVFEPATPRPQRKRGSVRDLVAPTPDETDPEDNDMLLPKQSLSPQARRHFKLFRNPFDGEVTSDKMMFVGDEFAYVREAAWQCAQTGGFVALCGESGAGKTTVLADLEARLARDAKSVIVIKPSVLGMALNDTTGKTLKSTDILHAVINQLDAQHTVPQTLQARTVCARKLLAASAQAGNTHLLVVEEAHSMPDATLTHLKRLHEVRDGRRALLGILLLAQPELKLRLAAGLRSGALREVAQRCEVVELLPLDADLRAYLELRAAACDVKLATLIDDAAIEQLRTRLTRKIGGSAVSMCYPLVVNNLVTKALNEAAAIGVPLVTRDVISAI